MIKLDYFILFFPLLTKKLIFWQNKDGKEMQGLYLLLYLLSNYMHRTLSIVIRRNRLITLHQGPSFGHSFTTLQCEHHFKYHLIVGNEYSYIVIMFDEASPFLARAFDIFVQFLFPFVFEFVGAKFAVAVTQRSVYELFEFFRVQVENFPVWFFIIWKLWKTVWIRPVTI